MTRKFIVCIFKYYKLFLTRSAQMKTSSKNDANIYQLRTPLNGSTAGYDIVNLDALQPNVSSLRAQVLWPDGILSTLRGPWTIPDYLENPHIVVDKRKKATLLDFFRRDGFIFITAKLKAIFDELAPGTCDYRLCKTEFSDGTPGVETWMCSPNEVFNDIVDLEASNISISRSGSYSLLDGDWMVFRNDLSIKTHVFRVNQSSTSIFCDEIFKSTCKLQKIRGIGFELIGERSR